MCNVNTFLQHHFKHVSRLHCSPMCFCKRGTTLKTLREEDERIADMLIPVTCQCWECERGVWGAAGVALCCPGNQASVQGQWGWLAKGKALLLPASPWVEVGPEDTATCILEVKMVAEGGAVLERDLSVKPGKKTGLVGELDSPGAHKNLGWEIETEKRREELAFRPISWTYWLVGL